MLSYVRKALFKCQDMKNWSVMFHDNNVFYSLKQLVNESRDPIGLMHFTCLINGCKRVGKVTLS